MIDLIAVTLAALLTSVVLTAVGIAVVAHRELMVTRRLLAETQVRLDRLTRQHDSLQALYAQRTRELLARNFTIIESNVEWRREGKRRQ